MQDVARNIDVVRQLEDAYDRRDYSQLPSLVREDLAAHTPGAENLVQDHAGLRMNNEGSSSAFADRRTEILDAFGEGDRVVARVRMTGSRTRAACRGSASRRTTDRSTSSGSRSHDTTTTGVSPRRGRRWRAPS